VEREKERERKREGRRFGGNIVSTCEVYCHHLVRLGSSSRSVGLEIEENKTTLWQLQGLSMP
jgi:hypothetical protein